MNRTDMTFCSSPFNAEGTEVFAEARQGFTLRSSARTLASSAFKDNLWILLSLGLMVLSAFTQEPAAAPRFQAVDVFVDSKAQPLAAYQIEITAPKESVKIVGIEGGEHAAFREPPFYDPKAIQHERVILAAFSTSAAGKLPSGRTRVATIHVQIAGKERPQFVVKLQTSATVDGKKIATDAAVEERKSK